jgi:hypothetical protein
VRFGAPSGLAEQRVAVTTERTLAEGWPSTTAINLRPAFVALTTVLKPAVH